MQRGGEEDRTSSGAPLLWKSSQLVGVLVTVAFLGGFLLAPERSLGLLWNAAIPLLPLTFLLNTALWRNLCPLATLNMLGNHLGARRKLTNGAVPVVGVSGIALLAALVPARRFAFNTDGVAMAVTVALIAVGAVLLGVLFDAKAGFCNSLCPVLPVERLYGQSPLVEMPNQRCPSCTACTSRGCIDLGARQSLAQTLGASGGRHGWMRTGFGAFAAMFPGFILGYYTIGDVPLGAAGSVYLHVALWAAGSYGVTLLVARALAWRVTTAMPVLAAVAVGIYYWFAAPILAEAYGASEPAIPALRVGALALVGVWLWRALYPRASASPARSTV